MPYPSTRTPICDPRYTLIPAWWPPLLATIARRDAEQLDRRSINTYDRDVVPGEWWPGQPDDQTFTRIRREADGAITRQLVLR